MGAARTPAQGPQTLFSSHHPGEEMKPRKEGGRAGLWAGPSAPISGETLGSAGPPDVWPCLADPDWASYTLGVFICLSCSGIHRNIPHVSKVKSVRLDSWEDVQVEVRPGRVPGGGACPLPRWPQTQPAALPAQAPRACCPASSPELPGAQGTRTGILLLGFHGQLTQSRRR